MLPVTVVIPTYNGAAFIGEALASVFAQTLPPREVIVVDDASGDGTGDIVETIAREASLPVHLVRRKRNSGGPARPINVGIEAARSSFIAVLDQDDLFAPDKLESQASVLTEDSNISLVGGRCALGFGGATSNYPEEVAVFLRGQVSTSPVVVPGNRIFSVLLAWGNFFLGYPGFLFRKAHWRAKGGVDENLPVASDYDLLCWLCLRGKVGLLQKVSYVRREHSANVCNNRLKMHLDCARVRARYLVQERWLLKDPRVDYPLQEWFKSFAYWAREAGSYQAALECLGLHRRVWGWQFETLKSILKLFLHWGWSRASGRQPIYTPMTQRQPAISTRAGLGI